MSAILETHIELDEQGRPWIIGANTKVIEVALDMISYGWDAEQIYYQHPHLTMAQIHSALAYYYDHKEEIDAEIAEQVKVVDALMEEARNSPLYQRLKERRGLR